MTTPQPNTTVTPPVSSTTLLGPKSILVLFALFIALLGGAYYLGQNGVDAFIKKYNDYRAVAQHTSDSLVRHSDSRTIALNQKTKISDSIIAVGNHTTTILVTQIKTSKDSIKNLRHLSDSLATISPADCAPIVAVNTALLKQDSTLQVKYDSVIVQKDSVIIPQYIHQISLKDSLLFVKDTTIHALQKTITNFPKPKTLKIFNITIPTWAKYLVTFAGGAYVEHKLVK